MYVCRVYVCVGCACVEGASAHASESVHVHKQGYVYNCILAGRSLSVLMTTLYSQSLSIHPQSMLLSVFSRFFWIPPSVQAKFVKYGRLTSLKVVHSSLMSPNLIMSKTYWEMDLGNGITVARTLSHTMPSATQMAMSKQKGVVQAQVGKMLCSCDDSMLRTHQTQISNEWLPSYQVQTKLKTCMYVYFIRELYHFNPISKQI